MIAVQENALVPHDSSEAIAFFTAQDKALVVGIVRNFVKKATRILVNHLQFHILKAAKRRGIRHVRVEDTCCVRVGEVDPGVNVECRRIRGAGALQNLRTATITSVFVL